MPPDLTVPAITGQAAPQVAPQPGAQPGLQPRASAEAPPPQAAPQFPNPSMRLDRALGMVVIEFRDPGGEVTRSIPSQRQIEAYRSHQVDTLPGAGAAEPPPPPAEDAPKDTAKGTA